MTVTAKLLIAAKDAENSQTTQYTAAVRTIIDKFTAHNHTGSAADIAVHLVPNGGSAGDSNKVALKTLAAGEAYVFPEVAGHVLEVGGKISTIAGTATAVSIRASGREITG